MVVFKYIPLSSLALSRRRLNLWSYGWQEPSQLGRINCSSWLTTTTWLCRSSWREPRRKPRNQTLSGFKYFVFYCIKELITRLQTLSFLVLYLCHLVVYTFEIANFDFRPITTKILKSQRATTLGFKDTRILGELSISYLARTFWTWLKF